MLTVTDEVEDGLPVVTIDPERLAAVERDLWIDVRCWHRLTESEAILLKVSDALRGYQHTELPSGFARAEAAWRWQQEEEDAG